jgi:orotidine-5'-phosphate decarboxylase
VVERALCAKAWGLDGVVCSGWEVAAVKAACGKDFLCLCPGIRFAEQRQKDAVQGEASENPSLWNEYGTGRYAFKDDQSRICTPGQAVLAGADFLVMGRPVTRAPHPAVAAHEALEAMGRVTG